MTTYPVTTVTAANGMNELILTTSTMNSNREECCGDITGAQGPVDLIVDLSGIGMDITVTLKAGDGPTAGKNRVYTVKQNTCQCISVSTGETLCADGMFYFEMFASGTSLANLKPRVAIVKRIRVETR